LAARAERGARFDPDMIAAAPEAYKLDSPAFFVL
jgi:hypothetical protein